MKVGDIVRVYDVGPKERPEVWGQIGMIAELLHAASTLPLANVMVLGELDQFYLDDLEKVCK